VGANRPKRLPVVLTKSELQQIFIRLSGSIKLIVDHEVTNAVTDRDLLSQMAICAKEIRGVEHLEALADMGYYHGKEIKRCIENGITHNIPKVGTSANRKPAPCLLRNPSAVFYSMSCPKALSRCATMAFLALGFVSGWHPCVNNSVDQFQMNLHLTKTNNPVTTSPISSLVLPVAEPCKERRLSLPSLPELSCSWFASCDLHRHRTCSLCVLIDARQEWLYAPFPHPFPQFAAPVACIHRQILLQSSQIKMTFDRGSL